MNNWLNVVITIVLAKLVKKGVALTKTLVAPLSKSSSYATDIVYSIYMLSCQDKI
jgi:hypothetical protein